MEQTTVQRIAAAEKRIDETERTVRIGTVTTVDNTARTARVSWSTGIRSAPLRVLNNGTDWMPAVGDMVVSLHRPSDDGAGFILGIVK